MTYPRLAETCHLRTHCSALLTLARPARCRNDLPGTTCTWTRLARSTSPACSSCTPALAPCPGASLRHTSGTAPRPHPADTDQPRMLRTARPHFLLCASCDLPCRRHSSRKKSPLMLLGAGQAGTLRIDPRSLRKKSAPPSMVHTGPSPSASRGCTRHSIRLMRRHSFGAPPHPCNALKGPCIWCILASLLQWKSSYPRPSSDMLRIRGLLQSRLR